MDNFLTSYAAFAYGSDSEGKVLLNEGGDPLWQSESGAVWVEDAVAWDTNNPAGYWMVNTGNPTQDAIATIAMNELGLDNFKRAADNFRDGAYIAMAREAAFGIGEVALTAIGLGAGAKAVVKSPKAFKAARAVAGQRRLPTGRLTQNQPGGFLNRARTAVFGGNYVDPNGPTGRARTIFRNGQRITRPGGPVLQQRPNAASVVAQRYRDNGLVRGVIGGSIRSTTKALRSGLSAGFPKGKRGGRIGALLYPLSILGIGLSRMNQAEEAGAEEQTEETDPDAIFEGINNNIAEATSTAQRDAGAIQAQYNSILSELRGMYNLSETEEEKERLRFMLSDIEAQRDAGLKAISEGYAKTVGDIRARGVKTQQEAQERAKRYGQELTGVRDASRERMISQQAAQVAANRGLGTGAGVSPENEYIELMSRYPGAQERYTQRMGDIEAEAIQFLADTAATQGQANAADLQRLAAATRSSTIARQQEAVANRINQERAALRDATMRIRMAGVAASQDAAQQEPAIDQLALREQIAQLGGINYSDAAIKNYFEPILGRQLTPSELAVGQYERQAYGAAQAMQAASTPVTPTGP